MCPSKIRKLKVIVYFRKVFLLSKFKYFCFVTILDMSLISRACKNDHIIFNVGTPSLEARNIRLVNIITSYVCGKCRKQFMLPIEKSVTFTGVCANEIIPSINRSFVYKVKEGSHVRISDNACEANSS